MSNRTFAVIIGCVSLLAGFLFGDQIAQWSFTQSAILSVVAGIIGLFVGLAERAMKKKKMNVSS